MFIVYEFLFSNPYIFESTPLTHNHMILKLDSGSNPLFGGLKFALSVFGKTDSIWVEGEGMLHALHFTKDAEGNWIFYYKNKYVETETYKMESQRKKPAFLPVTEGDAPAALAGSLFNVVRFPIFIKWNLHHLQKKLIANHNQCNYVPFNQV